ncbi:hypothetical protein [Corynebacterium sanguinis]
MARILLVSLRTGELGPQVARAEFNDVLKATGLRERDLEMRVISDANTPIGSLDAVDGVVVGGSSLNVTAPEYDVWQEHVHRELDRVRFLVPVGRVSGTGCACIGYRG